MNLENNAPETGNKSTGESWDTDYMIWTARSLQCLVEELNQRQKSSQPGPLLFQGKFVAIPVLLAFATEIALKALQCLERRAKPDYGHDLLKLFDGLKPETQTRLAKRLPEVPYPMAGPSPNQSRVRMTLDLHRKKFEQWRYLYEKPAGMFDVSEINDVLTALIKIYGEIKHKSS